MLFLIYCNNLCSPSAGVFAEENTILDTGGGILNAIRHFSNQPFLVINPDTIWNLDYLEELK